MEDFFIFALVGGVGVAILTSLIGNFILWKKMAYFGDSLAHTTLLGISISIFLEINPLLGALVMAIIFALLLVALKSKLESDLVLGILAQSSIAIAIILISLMKDVRVDLMGYLFGDILTITPGEIKIICFLCALTILWIAINWRPLLLICIDADLAKSQNVNVQLLDFLFTILIALVVVVSVKIVGVLLITALLIIPAASARNIGKSPLKMVFFSGIISIISVIIGLFSSLKFDSPSGPSIIVANLAFFLISLLVTRFSCLQEKYVAKLVVKYLVKDSIKGKS